MSTVLVNRTFEAPILVTGAGGFVGTRLVHEIASRGLPVVATDLLGAGPETQGDAVAWHDVDVRNEGELGRALETSPARVILHAAATTHGSPSELEATNVLGTRHVLEVARAAGVERVLFLSSGAVYGLPTPCPDHVDETAPLLGTAPYAASKIAAEVICRNTSAGSGTAVVVRLGSLYGSTERVTPRRPNVSVPRRVVEAVRSGSVRVFGASIPRSYCHVDDAARAIVDLALEPSVRWDTYNLDGRERVTLRDLLDVVTRLRPDVVPEVVDEFQRATVAMRAIDERPRLESCRLEAEIGPFPRRRIDEGIDELLTALDESPG